MISTYGQDAYTVLKVSGALVIRSILRDQEGKITYLNETLTELGTMRNHRYVQFLLQDMSDDTICAAMLEIIGLVKCFGHPNILMTESCLNWRTKTECPKLGAAEVGNMLENVFKLQFCKQYYAKHHKWPQHTLKDSKVSARVLLSIKSNTWKESTGLVVWTPEEFEAFEFDKNFEFDYFVDPSDLLSDKAIIGGLDQWIYEFDTQAYITLHGKWPKMPIRKSGRVILDYLTRNDLDLKVIMEIISNKAIPLQWRIMIAVAKEREFKREGCRFYAKMVQEMRLYQVDTEANIPSKIFPYVKQQSMTMTEEEYMQTIIKLNSQKNTDSDHSHTFTW